MRLIHNSKFCIGCQACRQACQDYHALPAGHVFMEIHEYERIKEYGIAVSYELNVCHQCKNAACIDVCPVKALHMSKDNVVLIDGEKCVGCGACVKVCPYKAILLSKKEGKVRALKCELCRSRGNKLPVCVLACPFDLLEVADDE